MSRGFISNQVLLILSCRKYYCTFACVSYTGNHAWYMYTLPVDQSAHPSEQCSNDMLGVHFDPLDRGSNPNYDEDCMNDPFEK